MRWANKTIVVMVLSLTHLFGFVQTRTETGAKIKWPGFANQIDLYINPAYLQCDGSTEVIPSSTVNSIINNSINEWNGHGDISINPEPTTTFGNDRNDLYFISRSNYTGAVASSVLAVTEVITNVFTGEIQEADVVIFNDQSFSSVGGNLVCSDTGPNLVSNIDLATNILGGPYYLGDIVTHEIGHMFGLGHSQTHGSTMLYLANKGSFSTEQDDQAGLASIYPNIGKGEITGTVIGSNSLIGVFGAQVSAISQTTGKVVQAVFTESNGSFSMQQLPLNDTYYLYINPINITANLNDYYSTVQKTFCSNNTEWVGSFFRKCGASQSGKPFGINLTSAEPSFNVGNASIRCFFDTPNSYSSGSGILNRINPVQSNGSVGEAVTGFFLDADIASNSSAAILSDPNSRINDKYEIDLTSFDIDDRGWTSKDLYLDIKIVSQGINSLNRFELEIRNDDSSVDFQFPTSDYNADVESFVRVREFDHTGVSLKTVGYDFDYEVHVELNELDTTKNLFYVDVIPQPITRATTINNEDAVRSSTIGVNSIKNESNAYLMILTISEKVGSDYVVLESKEVTTFDDNSLCPDAQNTFAVSPKVSNISRAPASDDEDQTAALLCGSIDSSGGENGQANMWLLFLMSIILVLTSLNSSKKPWFSAVRLS